MFDTSESQSVQRTQSTPKTPNEFEHHIICPVCGQGVACADVAEVMRHANPAHRAPSA
jgi:rubredoxin